MIKNPSLLHSILRQAAEMPSGTLCCPESSEHSRDEINAHIDILAEQECIEETFPQEMGFPGFYRIAGITAKGMELFKSFPPEPQLATG